MVPREKCPACGKASPRVLVDLPYDAPPLTDYLKGFYGAFPGCNFQPLAGSRYRLAECVPCGCIFQNPVPGPDFLAEFYERGLYGAVPEDPPAIEPYRLQHQVRELMMVVRFLQPGVPRPRVLDFGTGNGHWALLAKATGLETHACDLSEHAFVRLTTGGIPCHSSSDLPNSAFDLINTEQVFEHLTEPAAQLVYLKQCLRPGGIIKIGVPHDPNLRTKLSNPDWTASKSSPQSLNGVAPIEHLNHFEPASLREMARRAGLEPLSVRGWDLVRPSELPAHSTPRASLGRWLRGIFANAYQPHDALTQTAFFYLPL